MRKLYLWLELILVFVVLPLLYYLEYIPVHKAIPLLLVGLYCLVIVLKDKSFDRSIFKVVRSYPWRELFLKGVLFLIFTSAWVYFYRFDAFFYLPRNDFDLWLLVMVSYPLWSAYSQEFIYRAFFFHRYRLLFSNGYVMVFVNALFFSMAHIIFRNFIALSFTFFGSLLLSLTYLKNRSLNAVFLEHTIYGNILFTNGLGVYFYLPLG